MEYTAHRLDEVPSTINVLADLAMAGAPEGTYVTAKRMTAGRGRNGRPWVCAEGNLFFSLLLRPTQARASWGELSFVSGLATAEAIGQFVSGWAIKWPNDVLVDGKKISGILLESCSTPQGDGLIVGIGINIAHAPPVEGREVVCVSESAGRTVSVDAVLEALLARFAHWYHIWQTQGFEAIRAPWLANAAGVGQKIRVQLADGRVANGVFSGLAPSGALELDGADGQSQLVLAGDVFLL